MSLICFRNGSLAREAVLKQFDLDWDGFSQALKDTAPGNNGSMMLPWFEPEIVPRTSAGVQKHQLAEDDAAGHCRAVVEAQMMSMRNHSTWMQQDPTRIHVTGGASANEEILKIMANVFQVPVRRQETTNGAAVGAVLRAAHAVTPGKDWDALSAPFQESSHADVLPDPDTASLYDSLRQEYAAFERSHRTL